MTKQLITVETPASAWVLRKCPTVAAALKYARERAAKDYTTLYVSVQAGLTFFRVTPDGNATEITIDEYFTEMNDVATDTSDVRRQIAGALRGLGYDDSKINKALDGLNLTDNFNAVLTEAMRRAA